jgi:hypothetical protein
LAVTGEDKTTDLPKWVQVALPTKVGLGEALNLKTSPPVPAFVDIGVIVLKAAENTRVTVPVYVALVFSITVVPPEVELTIVVIGIPRPELLRSVEATRILATMPVLLDTVTLGDPLLIEQPESVIIGVPFKVSFPYSGST